MTSFDPLTERTPVDKARLGSMGVLKQEGGGEFLRAVTEAVLQTLMGHDVEGRIGAGL